MSGEAKLFTFALKAMGVTPNLTGTESAGMSILAVLVMKIKEIWFDKGFIYGKDDAGNVHIQSLLWYPALKNASPTQRAAYIMGRDGIHWRELDEDISFESFAYEDALPSPLQEFFLIHRELNIAEFAAKIGINPTLLRNYINGFKKPSRERERYILSEIRKLGEEYLGVSFS